MKVHLSLLSRMGISTSLSLMLLFTNCQGKVKNNSQQTNDSFPKQIDLVNNLDNGPSAFLLSDAVEEVTFVPLEVTDSSLIRTVDGVIITDAEIIILDPDNVFRFSREGTFLNKIGQQGEGPGEYRWAYTLFMDEREQDLYMYDPVGEGYVRVYNLKGGYVRTVADFMQDFFLGTHGSIISFDNHFFVFDPLPVMREHRKTYWSVALTDSAFAVQKTFYNPSFIGREEAIWENRANPSGWKNYWSEGEPVVDRYKDDLHLLYYQVDTIYHYNRQTENFDPAYTLNLGDRPTFELSHQWIKEPAFFNYLTVYDQLNTKDYLYLVSAQSDKIYSSRYDKKTGEILSASVPSERRDVPFPGSPGFVHKRLTNAKLLMKNDISGGEFETTYRSGGKYWAMTLTPEALQNMDVEAISRETVSDKNGQQQLVKLIQEIDEDANPVVVIAKLK